MNVVDSSGWLEYFADGPNADFFASAIEDTSALIIPSISLFEVFKRVLQQRDENEALQVVAVMIRGQVVELSTRIALDAAKISADLGLPMADSIILATARAYNATVWTQDADFENITGVRYIAKRKTSMACQGMEHSCIKEPSGAGRGRLTGHGAIRSLETVIQRR